MTISPRCLLAGVLFLGFGHLRAQQPTDSATAVTPASAPAPAAPAEDKRAFGVLPNHRTVEAGVPFKTITAGQKMVIALKDSFDIPVYPTAAFFAGIYQWENQNPSFGQGMKGYARRFGTALCDQVSGNMMTEGIMPAAFHEDPRYFRMGEGPMKSRIWYAATRIFVTKTDSGRQTFNFAEFAGNATTVAVSNAYYPDTRTARDNAIKLAVQLAADSFSYVLKEVWPDVKKKIKK